MCRPPETELIDISHSQDRRSKSIGDDVESSRQCIGAPFAMPSSRFNGFHGESAEHALGVEAASWNDVLHRDIPFVSGSIVSEVVA